MCVRGSDEWMDRITDNCCVSNGVIGMISPFQLRLMEDEEVLSEVRLATTQCCCVD